MITVEGHWTPSQLQILKTTKQKQNCSKAMLWTPGNKLPQNKQKLLQANKCPKIVPFFISLSLQTSLFVTLKWLLQHMEDYMRLSNATFQQFPVNPKWVYCEQAKSFHLAVPTPTQLSLAVDQLMHESKNVTVATHTQTQTQSIRANKPLKLCLLMEKNNKIAAFVCFNRHLQRWEVLFCSNIIRGLFPSKMGGLQ